MRRSTTSRFFDQFTRIPYQKGGEGKNGKGERKRGRIAQVLRGRFFPEEGKVIERGWGFTLTGWTIIPRFLSQWREMCIPSARNVRSKCKFRSRAIYRYATRNFDLTKFLFIENWSTIAPRDIEPDTWIHEQPIRQLVTARVKTNEIVEWLWMERNGIWILFFFFFFFF